MHQFSELFLVLGSDLQFFRLNRWLVVTFPHDFQLHVDHNKLQTDNRRAELEPDNVDRPSSKCDILSSIRGVL